MKKRMTKYSENNEGNDDQSEELVKADDIFAPSCLDDMHVSDFLNDNTTKRKLGVDESIVHYQITPLYYLWGESINFYMEDIYNLTNEGFKPWIFSGTEDIDVVTLGTLRYTVDEEWKPWNIYGLIKWDLISILFEFIDKNNHIYLKLKKQIY